MKAYLRFFTLVSLVFVLFLGYSYLQELIFSIPEFQGPHSAIVMTIWMCFIYSFMAFSVQVYKKGWANVFILSAPVSRYAWISFLHGGSTLLSNQSLLYLRPHSFRPSLPLLSLLQHGENYCCIASQLPGPDCF